MSTTTYIYMWCDWNMENYLNCFYHFKSESSLMIHKDLSHWYYFQIIIIPRHSAHPWNHFKTQTFLHSLLKKLICLWVPAYWLFVFLNEHITWLPAFSPQHLSKLFYCKPKGLVLCVLIILIHVMNGFTGLKKYKELGSFAIVSPFSAGKRIWFQDKC